MKPIISREQFLDLHAEGLTAREIAARLGCVPRSVDRLRNLYGLSRPTNTRPRTAADIERFGTMLDDGWSFKEIIRTERTTYEFLIKHFPGRGWSPVECGRHAGLVSKLGGAA